jgi:hypothetical protein
MTEETVSLRRSLLWGLIAFGVVLAGIIGVRLEQAALTVVVGVGCGVGASIPTSILIVALMHKRNEKQEIQKRRPAAHQPQVVVVTPQAAPQIQQSGTWPEQFALPVPNQRQFSVIGEDEKTDL